MLLSMRLRDIVDHYGCCCYVGPTGNGAITHSANLDWIVLTKQLTTKEEIIVPVKVTQYLQ